MAYPSNGSFQKQGKANSGNLPGDADLTEPQGIFQLIGEQRVYVDQCLKGLYQVICLTTEA